MIEESVLEQRLKRLERKNNIALGIAAILFCALIFVLGSRSFSLSHGVLKIEGLQLVDATGNPFAELTHDSLGSCLNLSDGKPRKTSEVRVCASGGSADLNLFSEPNGERVVLSAGGKLLSPTIKAQLHGVESASPGQENPTSGLFVENERTQRVVDITVDEQARLELGHVSGGRPTISLETNGQTPRLLIGNRELKGNELKAGNE